MACSTDDLRGVVTEPRTIGAYLRAARRKRRISIERAAEETRIRADFLMRMESDEFDFLATAYVRGFLRSYARYLGVDPEPVVEEFDRRFGAGRVDTAQIAALERRTKRLPRERRRTNNWAVAAVVALLGFTGLGIIGILSSPDEPEPAPDDIAGSSPSPEVTVDPSPAASPSPSETPQTIAFDDGIDVEIVATKADCWVDVTADGQSIFSQTIPLGSGSGTLHADRQMNIVLGNAGGVELIVEGKRIRDIGGEGEVVDLTLPRDLERFL